MSFLPSPRVEFLIVVLFDFPLMESLKRAAVNVISQLCIVYIDVGDKTLNMALCTLLITAIDLLISRLSSIMDIWYQWRYEWYITDIEPGRLNNAQRVYIMRNLKLNRVVFIDHVNNKRYLDNLVDNWKSDMKYYRLVDSSNNTKLASDIPTEFRGMLVYDGAMFALPVWKHETSIIYILYQCGTNINNSWLVSDKSEYSADDIFASERFADMTSIEVYPYIDGNAKLGLMLGASHNLPKMSLRSFIHADFDNIYSRVLKFRDYRGDDFMNLGIILYGPPGTGKTTFVAWLCNVLDRHCVSVNLSKPGWTAHNFKNLLIKPKQIINISLDKIVYYFDEFDMIPEYMFSQTRMGIDTMSESIKTKSENNDRLSLAMSMSDQINLDTLLTTFEGIVKTNRRVIVACTNDITKIEPRLLRPGRFGDIKIAMHNFTRGEVVAAMQMMENPPTPDLLARIPANIPEQSPVEFITATRIKSAEEIINGFISP